MCVDSLIELIDNRVQTTIDKSAYINSLVAQVTSVGIDKCGVKLLTTGVTYNLPNYSGSDVEVGEKVYVYYKGGFLSEQTAYIGESVSKNSKLSYILSYNFLKELSSTAQKISVIRFNTSAATTINYVFNSVIESDTSDLVTFTILIDDEEYDYISFVTANDGFTHCSFTLQLELEEASEHIIDVKATGSGEISQVKSYIFGTNIEESEWYLTTEDDYIYAIRDGEAILLIYIGSHKRIITPTTVEDVPVTAISNSCFMDSDVEAVMVSGDVTTVG